MSRTELLRSLARMTLEERLALIEEVLHGVRTDLSARGEVPADRSQRLESAARALRDDYEHDAECA